MSDEVDFSLALEEARRSADILNDELPLLRNRATQLLSVSGLTAGFLGGFAFSRDVPMSFWDWLAIATFVVTAGLCLALLRPRRFYMSIKPGELIKWAETPGVSAQDMKRDLALHMGKKYEINRERLDSLSKLYTASIIALLIQIVIFVINIWR